MSEASSNPSTALPPVAVFKKRGAKGKANLRKRPATPPPASDSDNSEYSSSEDESGQRVKRRKKNAAVTASSKNNLAAGPDLSTTIFSADRNRELGSTNDATKQSNWYDEESELSAKNLLGSRRTVAEKDKGDLPDGTYRGLANQTSYIQKKPDAPSRTVGPIKAATNIRTITITDMAPDVCTDYKKTGFCGFGDNCKFLHAREDYKAGWQLDKEWEEVTKGKKNLGGTVIASADRRQRAENDEEDEEDAMLENIPFACIICQGPYRAPVVTRCGHYFCEPCALQRYRKDPGCAACGAGTSGVFNSAKRLEKLLQKKRDRAAKRRQAAIEAGEEVSDEEGEDEDE